ncbi:MAG: Ig-like domain-containing protein [Oscillospiraceae bacterium]|nr:Ig-like domain-containing protein [Oscillospiraceae bacterium]
MKTKKLLSLVLAICMLVSMLPGISITAGAEEINTTFRYDFGAFMSARSYKWNESGPWITNMSYENTNGLYKYAASSIEQTEDDGSTISGNNYIAGSNRHNPYLTVAVPATGDYYFQLGGNRYVAFEIYVPVTGTYKFNVGYRENATAGTMKIYMNQGDAPSTAWNYQVSQYSMAMPEGVTEPRNGLSMTLKKWDTSTSALTDTDLELELTKGYYYVSFKGSNYSYIKYLELQLGEGGDPILIGMKTAPTLSLDAGDNADFETTLYMGDGSVATKAYEITYKSDNDEIATVDASGRIIGVSAGTTTVTATAVSEAGEDITATKTVTVIGTASSTENAGIYIEYDLQSRFGTWSNDSIKFADWTYASNKGLWEYYGNEKNLPSIDSSTTYNWGNGEDGSIQAKSGWFAIKIVVPKSGNYTPRLNYTKYYNYGKDAFIDLYMVKADHELSTSADFIADNLLGSVNCTDAAANPKGIPQNGDDAAKLDDKYIEAGEYYLVWSHRATGGAWTYIRNFRLDGKGTATVLSGVATEDSATVFKGGSADFDIAYYNNDGSSATGTYAVSYKSDDADIAEVSASGKITGIAPGETVITASVTNEAGAVLTAKKKVTVVTDEIKILYNLNEDMTKLGMVWYNTTNFPNRPSVYALDYAATNGFYKFHSAKSGIVADTNQTDDNYLKYTTVNGKGTFQVRGTNWLAIEIFVPRAGTYNLETYVNESTYFNSECSVYFAKAQSTDAANYVGKYNSSDTEPSKTPETRKIGSINVAEAGSYVLTFVPEADGAKYTTVHAFALVAGENSQLMNAKISADAETVEVYQPNFKVTAEGYLSATAAPAEFTYTSSDDKIAQVDAKTGVVTPVAPGEVTITATADVKYGEPLTKKITVVPSTNPMYQRSGVKVEYNISDFGKAHSRSKTVLFRELDWVETKGFLNYHSNSHNWDKTEDWSICFVPTGMQLARSRWFAYEIYVPAVGTYSVSTKIGGFNRSGNVEVYLSPSDGDKPVTNSSYLVNTIDTNKSDSATSNDFEWIEEPFYLGELVVAKPGYYRVAFRAATGDYGSAGNLILDGTVEGEAPKTAIMRPAVSSERTIIKAGESETLTTSVYNNRGEKVENATVTYAAKTPDIATIDAASGVVTALKAGNAVFTATASDGVTSVSTDYEIKVNPKNGSGYVVTYDIDANTVESATFENTNDFYAFNSKSADYTAVNIKVPVSGEYLVKSEGEVYILPKDADIATALDGATANGVVDLAAGEYIAVIKGNVGDIVLDGGEGLALMKATLSVENSKATLSGILSDGSVADMTKATVSFASSNKSVATINSVGVISENAIGTTTLTANVSLEKVTKTITFEYEVTEAPMDYSGVDVVYNFRLKNGWTTDMTLAAGYEDAKSLYDVRGITYEYTGVGKEPGNWEYRGVGDNTGWETFAHVSGELECYGSYLKCRLKRSNQYMAFNIKVPAAGKYSPTLEYMKYTDGETELDLHIIPGDTANEDIFATCTDDTYFGTVTFVDKSLTTTVAHEITLNNLFFDEAGEYILVFKQPSNAIGTYFRPIQLRFDGVNCLVDADATVNKSELFYGEEADISVSATRLDGTDMDASEYTVEYDSLYPKIVSVDKNGHLTAKGDGESIITVKISDGIKTVEKKITVKATDNTGIVSTKVSVYPTIYVRGAEKLEWRVVMASGNEIVVSPDAISYSFSEEGIASADSEGRITGLFEGEVEITLNADFRGTPITDTVTVTVIPSTLKTEPSYYTYERRANAKENIQKYNWAKSSYKSAITAADKWTDNYEVIYDNIPGEGIPRSGHIGFLNDPDYKNCKFCGTDVEVDYDGWTVNVVTRPWKLQCPKCKRLFPSNDFELLYKRGIDEQGYYDRDRAIAANAEAVANGEKDALKNDLYPELSAVYQGKGLRPSETVEKWGVDDGFGYIPLDENGNRFVYSNGVEECHAYIAHYVFRAYGSYTTILSNLATAYTYTDDIKYGRAGAIILDRIADVYPSFDNWIYKKQYPLSCGGSGRGNITGRIADPSTAQKFAVAADAFFPALTDSQVISFLEEKAEKWGLEYPKSSANDIWQSWDDNLLDQIFVCVQDGRINGNYGLYHHALSSAAIVKDSDPETTEMLEWLFAKDDESTDIYTLLEGGDFNSKFIDVVDRDGMGNEASVAYNGMWLGRLHGMSELLSYYKGDKENLNPWNHPKFVNMFIAFTKTITANYTTLNVGDGYGTAVKGIACNQSAMMDAFKAVEGYPELRKRIANMLYIANNYNVSSLNYGIYEKNPERIQDEILECTNGGEIPHFDSEMMTGYGIAFLRDGYQSLAGSGTATNTLRDFWIWFGRNAGHGHDDILVLGMEAYGLNLLPDLGYPEITGTDAQRLQWVSQTVAHNTVSVDRKGQDDNGIHGYPLHFDDSGKIKVADIRAPKANTQCDEFRRSIVMVEVDDNVSYGVDFFRIIGGDVHTYSLHSQAENAYAVEGLEMVEQKDEAGNWKGSYADPEWPVGEDPNSPEAWTYETVYPRGYSWLGKVRRDMAPDEKFAVEFDVEDYRKAVDGGSDIVLRATQINNFTASEVALASGPVPKRTENKALPTTLDYMYVHREGENLDSLFTTVLEPYKGSEGRYIKDINAVEVVIKDGSEVKNDIARAVKVEHTNGRVDWVVYATNNKVTYTIDNEFDFRGFVGVYSKNENGEVIYRYVNDGDIIGEATDAYSEYTGTVVGYQEELAFENYIDIKFNESFDPETLAEKYVYIDNDDVENGVYRIESAEDIGNGVTRIHTGLTTQIRSHIDPYNMEKGYIYNIKVDQDARIPLAFTDGSLPEFNNVPENLTASAGSTMTLTLNAESPLEGKSVSYKGATLPRGASIDEETGTITWKPTSSQVGENHFAITAVDSDGRENTIHFNVTVYGSTSGGGGGTSITKPETPDKEDTDKPGVGEDIILPPTESDVRFTDLGNHAWAADAINSLADKGIIKGTSETTYSPANNITRADFAILLVRAFEKESDNTENFADVNESDYFAKELAIARNTGLVSGIGGNKFAPRDNIKRCDMMLMVYRVIKDSDALVGADIIRPEYEDFDSVPDYAKEAVSALIGAGLVNGKSGKIEPNDNTTRAEVAVLLARVLEFVAEK